MADSKASSGLEQPNSVMGRRRWFKQTGVSVAGLALGGELAARSDKAGMRRSKPQGDVPPMRGEAKLRRGIDCGFDEGPI